MPAPRSHLVGPTVRALLVACAGAAVGSAVLDVTKAALQSNEPTPASALFAALRAALGLYGAVAIAAGLLAGTVLGCVRAVLPEEPVARFRRRARSDDDFDRSAASGLLAAGVAAGVLAIVVFAFARGFALEMASKRNGALSTALVAAAALVPSLCAWFPAYLILRRAVVVLPRPRALVALGLMAAAAALGVVAAVASVDWRVIDFGPFLALGWFTALALGHLWFWNGGPGVAIAKRMPPALLWAARLGTPAALALSLLVTLRSFGGEPRSLALVAEETAGARPILHLLQRAADRDHDGYAAILGGGDCNDHDPSVNPGAADLPGNGVDEDCSGSDAVPRARRPPAEAPEAPQHATAQPPAQANAGHGNLLIITVDTLRADRLDATTMPNLSAFAKDATVFTHAYAQAPNTPRSFPSFLTSRFPSQIHWQKESLNFSPILDDNTTFFEALHAAGLRTIGEFSHFYLDPKNGVSQGFDEWDDGGALTLHDSNTDIAAPRITPKVVKRLRELAASKQRFVLWTHYFEPHSRYMEHPEFPVHGSGFKALEEKYDGEVSFVDRHIRKVLDELHADGLDENTTVVVFSDHGEAFGEHRFGGEQMFFHGQTLYDELLRVPLLVRVPGQPGRKVDARVMLLDLGPTLCELAGAKVPAAFMGRSLAPALRGAPLDDQPVYAEMLPATSWQHSWRALVDGKWKVIDKISENSIELYDLESDPKEQRNQALVAPAEARRMKQALRDFMGGLRAEAATPPSTQHASASR